MEPVTPIGEPDEESAPERREVAEKVAEAEFIRFCETWDADTDTDKMDPDDEKSFRKDQRRFVRAMMRGDLELDEDGCPTYTPRYDKNQQPLTFRGIRGGTMLKVDPDKKNRENAKVLGRLTRQKPERFFDMDLRDFKVCNALGNVFLD